MKRQRGFTLMEMLVVVAVIAVLTAIAIPAFSGSLDSARAATCAANRRSLKGVLSAVYMTEGADAVEPYYETHKGEYPCPAGGTIRCPENAGIITVTCSVHTGSFGNDGTIEILAKNLEALGKDLDSAAKDYEGTTGFAGAANQLVTNLAAEGLDLESMGAKSWHYSKDGKFFFWTPVDIGTLDPGTKLPVLRYNLNTGTYTVWINQVAERTLGGHTYPVLNGACYPSDGYAPSTGGPKDEQTYENAMAHFNEAMKAYPDLAGGG